METLTKIHSRLLKIEKTLKKFEKTDDFSIEELVDIEQNLNHYFNLLEDRETFYLQLDVRTDKNKKELIDTVNCINFCDNLWHRLIALQEKRGEEGEFIDEEGYKREVWDMMYPDEDINSDSFEIDNFEND
ncbi:MAG: hypothetical protein HDS10_00775 [Bacteroides sp.]|nr:hypothetical protein [Bacteroides sp.]